MPIKPILLSVAIIAFGVLLIVSSIRKNKRCSSKVVGTITGRHESEGTDNEGYKDYSYSPEFEYKVDGQVYRSFGGPSYRHPDKIIIGGDIDIYYNPDKPKEYYIKGGVKIRTIVGIVAIAIGALAAACALF